MRRIYDNLSQRLQEALRNIKFIAVDFDGTLTDNSVIHNPDGTESIVRSRMDSFGIDLLSDAGLYDKKNYKSTSHEVDLMIMSREANPVVASVSQKIKMKCLQGQYEKFEAFKQEVKSRGLDYPQVLFMGNDLNDIECIQLAGIGVAVADAMEQVKNAADYITKHAGGKGAFREICELMLYARGLHPYQE